jgi:threonine/homoserine/homoserine lactone efflux protein
MQHLKNILVGFAISFVGSIPLGYLNVVGFDVYNNAGVNSACLYLLGVVFIEFFVILITLLFANKLISNKKLLQFIEAFSVVFMFFLAILFYTNANNTNSSAMLSQTTLSLHPLVLGILLSCLNFIQIPFWLSWNLFLLNAKHIEITNEFKYSYLFGTSIGTFSGMLTLILSLSFVTHQTDFLNKYLIQIILPLVFFSFGILQGFKFYKKYLK